MEGTVRAIPARAEQAEQTVVSEVKFKRLPAAERRQREAHLADGWQRSALADRFQDVAFEILDVSVLE
jgi:hypothetical protein